MKIIIFIIIILSCFIQGTIQNNIDIIECAVCNMGVNAIERLMAENLTESIIESIFNAQFCKKLSGDFQYMCQILVEEIPVIMKFLDNEETPGMICHNELGLCKRDPRPLPDGVPVPHFTIDLDLPPEDRWTALYSLPQYQTGVANFMAFVTAMLSADFIAELNMLGESALPFFPAE